VLKKIYWLFLEIIMYVIMSALFCLVYLTTYLKVIMDKFFYNFFSIVEDAFDTVYNWFTAPRCKCKLKKKDKKDVCKL